MLYGIRVPSEEEQIEILTDFSKIAKEYGFDIDTCAERINLEEIGISKEMIPTLAKQAINDVCTSGNPRETTIKDLVDIYEKAYK